MISDLHKYQLGSAYICGAVQKRCRRILQPNKVLLSCMWVKRSEERETNESVYRVLPLSLGIPFAQDP